MTACYLNHAFAKQPHPEVLNAMVPFLRDYFENPLTESESAEKSRTCIRDSRASVALLLNASPSEIFFVSSGTEANNWALKGPAFAMQKRKKHLIVSAIEHFSVFQTAEYLSRQGWELSIIPVHSDGLLDIELLRRAIRPDTVMVSVQASSDEIGVVQDLQQVISLKNNFDDVLFHTDAVQYLCYEDLDAEKLPFDLVSLSSNALYGPAGIAALYVREGTRLVPLLHGGMQEEGLRPGFQSTAFIAGFGKAAEIDHLRKDQWRQQVGALQQKVFDAMDESGVFITANRVRRTVDNIHITTDVDGEAVLALLQSEGISASSGSTCYQFAQKESHVLKAIGMTLQQARGSMLFTLGIDHTQEQIDSFTQTFRQVLYHLRAIKPNE